MHPLWLLLIIPGTIILTALGCALWLAKDFMKGF